MPATKNNQRATLELPLNVTMRLKLMKDKCYQGENQYGAYYLYSVLDESGAEYAYFASDEVHEQILQHGLKSGDYFDLTKAAVQNGKRVTSQIMFSLPEMPSPQPVPMPIQKMNGNGNGNSQVKVNGNGHAGGNGKISTDNFKDVMLRSLNDAVEITHSVSGIPFQNEDIQKLASCLFIARTR